MLGLEHKGTVPFLISAILVLDFGPVAGLARLVEPVLASQLPSGTGWSGRYQLVPATQAASTGQLGGIGQPSGPKVCHGILAVTVRADVYKGLL